MAVEPQLIAQVEDRASRVEKAIKNSVLALFNKPLGGAAAASAASALKGLEPQITAWATRGRLAAKNGKPPMARDGTTPITWEKWVTVGETYLQGINDITKEGLDANLELIKETAAAVPATAVKVAAKTAQVAATVAKETVSVAADMTFAVLRPFLIPIVVAGGIAVFVYLKTRGP